MKTRTLFVPFIIAAIFSSCTTTLQQRRVADELYDTPQTPQEEQVAQSRNYQDQLQGSKDTLDRKYKRRYGYVPPYGYHPHRWYPHYYWPDWYYWDFYPSHPFYGYGYPWYGGGFFGFHSYWHSPYYGYYPYYPWNYYPFVTREYKRKLSSNAIRSDRNTNITAPHTQRIRKSLATPVNKSLNTPDLKIPSRDARMPLRTIRATEGTRSSRSKSISTPRKRMNYIRPSNIRQGGAERKYNIVPMNSRKNGYRKNQIIQKRTPVYRSPSHPVNRIHHVRPSGSTRIRK